MEKEIKFHVSGREYTVYANDVSPETTLNTYLRENLHLTATKKMCLEGGCGTCIVAVEEVDAQGHKKFFSVNSCLVSILSCHGWKIHTNEGIGNPLIGFHDIQKLLADNNGSQCGFCASGWVMSAYALNEAGPLTKAEIENLFGGNLCRCTGYRPILTAFKKLATDADELVHRSAKIVDVEDFKPCIKENCLKTCKEQCKKAAVNYELKDSRWVKVYDLVDLLQILGSVGTKKYMLVAGNTARGVYWPSTSPDIYIDIASVAELTSYTLQDNSLILGANYSLTDTMKLFRNVAASNTNLSYLSKLADHIDLVAHVPVRNIGTLAGNLMIKYMHNEFPSDIFLILETINATLIIVDIYANETRTSPLNFLKLDMKKKVIKQIIFPGYDKTYYHTSYKIMPRAQNAHALVNAGFLFKLDQGTVKSARIVYGAINPTFIHAKATEKVLVGKKLFANDTLQLAFDSLYSELKPDWVLPDPKPEFRKQLAINLFYKCILSIAPSSQLTPKNKSGGSLLIRPVSSAAQTFTSYKDLYPLTQPIIKVEALAQTTGQAQYVMDIPDLPGQLYGILVQVKAPAGSTITKIDASQALSTAGVVAFYSAKDIPGLNAINVMNCGLVVNEELFCSGTVQYYSQPVGVLIATSHNTAWSAANKVTVSFTAPTSKPVLNIKQVLSQNLKDRITHQTSFVPKSKGKDVKKVIKGQTYLAGQYHFHMETQSCQIVPTEDGFNVFASTQWMDHIQGVVAQVLNISSQRVNVFVRRLGGAFGAKITRDAWVVGAAALAASKLRKPVRMWMPFRDNMDIIGKRYPFLANYEVGVNATGTIQYLEADFYSDYGVGGNEPIDGYIVGQIPNGYVSDTFTFDTYKVKTDMSANGYMRAPGSLEGTAAIEIIMDHIAHTLKLDPFDVRKANFDSKNNPILVQLLDEILTTADIKKRKEDIKTYNEANRWKKKGLSVVPMKWILEVPANYTTMVSIYHLDGGVAVTHGGSEMGQGINTKVVQVCAYKFGIPIEKVQVKPGYNVITPNDFASGGSLTSEAIVYALIQACDILLARIKPVRDKNPNASWEELIQKCYVEKINLSTNGYYTEKEPNIQSYPIYGVCALEVEVDILTGKHEILRVDILEDVGRSMSPLIDIGQLEGAFIMGLGYFTTEELIYDDNGRLTNDRTWNYKVYGAKDIPVDFRVKFADNTFNPVGVLKAKAIGEPPTCLSVALPLALRLALASARTDASPSSDTWYPFDGPSTVESTLLNTFNNYKQYTL